MEAVLRGKFIALSAHIKKMEKFFVCEVPGQQGALSLYQKIHWLGEYVPDRRQKPQKESTDIPQPFKLSLQGLLSQTTASLFLSHPSLHPSTPSLLLGHKTPPPIPFLGLGRGGECNRAGVLYFTKPAGSKQVILSTRSLATKGP